MDQMNTHNTHSHPWYRKDIDIPAGGSFYLDIQFSSVKGNRLCDDRFLMTLSIFQRFHCFNKLVQLRCQ